MRRIKRVIVIGIIAGVPSYVVMPESSPSARINISVIYYEVNIRELIENRQPLPDHIERVVFRNIFSA